MVGPVLIFDSGVGGLSVAGAVRHHSPRAALCYACDNAMLPYGKREDGWLVKRIVDVCLAAVEACHPRVLVVACNTASTLALDSLRAHLAIPVVGTVPAIKPAAQHSRSRHIGLVATSATVARPYTQRLIDTFAGDCRVTRVAADELVVIAERWLRGEPPSVAAIDTALTPVWQATREVPPLDTVVLGCTHFPLLKQWFASLSPCPLAWIDSGDAIARRVMQVAPGLEPHPLDGRCFTTAPAADLQAGLAAYGFTGPRPLLVPPAH